MKEIEARQLLSIILDLAAALSSLRAASALLMMDRKEEAVQSLKKSGDQVDKVLSAAQRLVDQESDGDAV